MLYFTLFTEIGSRNTERNTQNGVCFFSEMFMNAELHYFCLFLSYFFKYRRMKKSSKEQLVFKWVCGGGRSLFRFSMWSLGFFIELILPATTCPWGRLSLKRKGGTRDISWDVGGRCTGLTTLPPTCSECLKTPGLTLPETQETIQVSIGISLT
jgi:hypothetical protein